MASATMLNEPSTPLRCGGESRSIIAAYSVPLTLRSISSGCDIHDTNSCGVGMKTKQVCKDFSRGFYEERVFVVPVGEKRCGQSQSIGSLPQFVSWGPVGHPLVQRI